MKPFIIGIAGGSGSGKTTLANGLKKKLGKRASILSLDNYQRFGQKLPVIDGIKNWDSPLSVNWDKFIKDLRKLKASKSVMITHREQKSLKSPKKVIFLPNKILIIDGYLLFHLKSVREMIDFLIFTSAKDKIRVKRRTKFKNDKYIEKVLLPMHKKYIEPTKMYADLILDTEKLSLTKCVNLVDKSLKVIR